MKAQKPAEGILITHDWGDAKMYHVNCSCGNDDDSIQISVEVTADDHSVSVCHYTTQRTDYWTEAVQKRYDIDNEWLQEFDWFWKDLWNNFCTRVRLTKDIWIHGYAKYQSTTVMTEQQTLNYAETLKSAIKDCRDFHNTARGDKK